MSLLQSGDLLNIPAPDFTLPATDGKTYRFTDIQTEKGLVIVFICNHCPYVVAIVDRLVDDAQKLLNEGFGFAAICSNDARTHPADSFDRMADFAKAHSFPFPYLHDESQAIAKAYDAVCTPDFYGISAAGLIQYRGRLDEGRVGDEGGGNGSPTKYTRELVEAMHLICETGSGPAHQAPSMGCSIKWKA